MHHEGKPPTTTSAEFAEHDMSRNRVSRVSDVQLRRTSESIMMDDTPALTGDASRSADGEKNMTLRDALRVGKKGILWAIVCASSTVMEGFDLALLGGFYAFPAFQVPAPWQTALSAGAQMGQIIGLCLSGHSMGRLQAMPASYAAEIVPMVLRPYITTYSNLCWVFGQLLATGVLRACLSMGEENEWAYRSLVRTAMDVAAGHPPYSWSSPPNHLGFWRRKGKASGPNFRFGASQITTNSRSRMPTKTSDTQCKWTCNAKEAAKPRAALKGTLRLPYLSFPRCFKGQDRRRTEIACGTWISQSLCGSNLMGFAPYFFQAAGLTAEAAFSLQLGGLAFGIMGTLMAWVLMTYFGRRKIYIVGLGALCGLLLLMAILSFVAMDKGGVPWTVAILLAVYIFVYDSTVGPCCYSIVTEVPSVQRRAATVALARICYNLCGIFSVTMNPLMLNPTSWGWGTKGTLFWAALCAICLAWTYFRLPETKGRSFAELDILFRQNTSARKFQKTVVNPYETGVLDVGEPIAATSTQVSQEKVAAEHKA
ncbi:MFS alpha-glucoside transporter-like protein [Apiospora phragmitis]|uniref:MFS alpha-glucoside transporter-like protein n=1 Tax=Apiospora phragmitis TaxID=2905665 RepID=A0ABR1TRV5_9PEZI